MYIIINMKSLKVHVKKVLLILINFFFTADYIFCVGRYVAATIPKCGGCQEVILDKYVLRVLERCWHARCLTCRDCGARLTDKCFARNGHVFCKDDFFK